ncbi:MAG: universal stress protein [Anaerolineae bacterium]
MFDGFEDLNDLQGESCAGGLFHHVLVPVDGSAASISAGKMAIAIAETHCIPITFVYVINLRAAQDVANASRRNLDLVCQDMSAKAENYLNYLMNRARARHLEADELIRRGVPHREIAATARERGADLIVMGQAGGRGTGQFRRAHIGSVTQQVIEHAPCPVLVVRHDALRR